MTLCSSSGKTKVQKNHLQWHPWVTGYSWSSYPNKGTKSSSCLSYWTASCPVRRLSLLQEWCRSFLPREDQLDSDCDSTTHKGLNLGLGSQSNWPPKPWDWSLNHELMKQISKQNTKRLLSFSLFDWLLLFYFLLFERSGKCQPSQTPKLLYVSETWCSQTSITAEL